MNSEVHYSLASQTGLQSPLMADTMSPKQIQASPTLQDARVSPQMRNSFWDSHLQDLRTLVSGISNESNILKTNIHSEIKKQNSMSLNAMNQEIPSGSLKSTLNSEDPRNVISVTDPCHLLDTLEEEFGDFLNSMEVTCSSLQSTPKKNYIEDQLFSPISMDSGVILASNTSSVGSSQPVTTCDTASTEFVPCLSVSGISQTVTLPTVVTTSSSPATPVAYLSGNQLIYPMSSITVKDNGMHLSENQSVFLRDSQTANTSGVNPTFGSNQYILLASSQGKNTEQVAETPTINVDPITTNRSDTNCVIESQAAMKNAAQVTLEETVYALSENDYCQCDSEEKGEEVPVEQIFIRDGQMFRLPDVGTILVGKLEFCGFRKQEKWYLGLAEVIHKVGPIFRKEFEEAVLNTRELDVLELDANEFDLLLQRSKISRHWQLRSMMELKCLHNIFVNLHKEDKDPVIKTIAEGPFYRKTDGSEVRCTNCGLKIKDPSDGERLELLLKKDVEAPLFEEHYAKPSAKYQSSVGFLHIFGLNIELNAFKLKTNDYISLKEIVFKKIFSLTTLQKRLLHLQVRPIRAPSEIEYYFQLHGIEVQRTLWVDIVAVRCMCCLTGMKELDTVTRAISCGQFKYKEMLTLITEDTTIDDTVFTLDEESLEICRFNEKLTIFGTKKSHPNQTDTCTALQRPGRRKKYGGKSNNIPATMETISSGSGQTLSKLADGKAVYVKIATMDKSGKARAVSHIKQNLNSATVTTTIPQGRFIVEDLDRFLYKHCTVTKRRNYKGGVEYSEKSKVDLTEDARNKTKSDSCNKKDLNSKIKVAVDSSYIKENDLPSMLQEKTQISHIVIKSPNTKILSANANLEDKQANPNQNNAKVEESKLQNESSIASVGKVAPGSIAPGMYIVKDMESFLKSLQKEKSGKASKTAKTHGTNKTAKSDKSKNSSEPSVQQDHNNLDTRVETSVGTCSSVESDGYFASNTSDACWEKFKVSDTNTSQIKDRNESIEDMDNSYHVQSEIGATVSAKHSSVATVKEASPSNSNQKEEMLTKGSSSSSPAVFSTIARDKNTCNSNTQKTSSSFSPFTELGLDKPLSDSVKMQVPKQLFSGTDQVLQSISSLETVIHSRAHTAENSSPSPNIFKTASSKSKRKSKSPTKLMVRMNFSKAVGTPMKPKCQRNLSFNLDMSNKETCSVEKSDSATSNKTSLEEHGSLQKSNVTNNYTVLEGDSSVRIQDSSKEYLHTSPSLQKKAVVKLNENEIFDASCVSYLSNKSCSVSMLCGRQNELDEVMEPQESAEISIDKDESSFSKPDISELFERDVTPVTIASSSSSISTDTEVEVLESGLEEGRVSSAESQISESPIISPSHDTKAASAPPSRLQKLSTKIVSMQQASAPGDSLQMLAAIAEAMNDDCSLEGSDMLSASGDNTKRKFPIDISSLDTEQRKVFAIKLKEKMEEMLNNIKKYIEVRKCEGSNEMFKVRMRFKPGAEKVFPALVKPGAKEKRQQFVMVLSRILARKFWSSQLASQELKTSTQSDMAAKSSTLQGSKEVLEHIDENKEQNFKVSCGAAGDSEKCTGNEMSIPVSESKLSVSKIKEEIDSIGEMFIKEHKQDSTPSMEQVVCPKIYDTTQVVCGRNKILESNAKEFNVEGQTDVVKQASRTLRSRKRPAEVNYCLSNSKMSRK
ncbi:hypothetical protein ACJMK2_006722 [Sinanodonta woodiana]|uniref:Uncharacterized protein n=1 Tax=Sinanodonta woodiana TaxID=1069815 RepID=A0ABD3VVC9_SINWO